MTVVLDTLVAIEFVDAVAGGVFGGAHLGAAETGVLVAFVAAAVGGVVSILH